MFFPWYLITKWWSSMNSMLTKSAEMSVDETNSGGACADMRYIIRCSTVRWCILLFEGSVLKGWEVNLVSWWTWNRVVKSLQRTNWITDSLILNNKFSGANPRKENLLQIWLTRVPTYLKKTGKTWDFEANLESPGKHLEFKNFRKKPGKHLE